MTVHPQLSLDGLWVCDCCQGSRLERDPATGLTRRCRICQGEGLLPYEPPTGANPFQGLASANGGG